MLSARLSTWAVVVGTTIGIPAAPAATRAEQDAAPLARIPFELHRNKIVIPVTLNGAGPFDFILDTGAPVTILGATSLAQRLGVTLERSASIGGAGDGDAPAAAVSEPVTIAVGDVVVDRARVVVFDLTDPLAQASGRQYHGVIGKLLFDRFVVCIDFDGGVIELFDPATYVPPTTADVVPLRFELGHPHLDARVRLESGLELARDLVIDTGARPALMLDIDPADGVVASSGSVPMVVGRGARGPVRGIVGRVAQLAFGRSALNDVVTVFADDAVGATPSADGNLGVEALRRFRVTFDYQRRRMLLERGESASTSYPVELSGITLGAEGAGWNELVVTEVRPASPAWVAGIRAGDTIDAVDGHLPNSLAELERRLQQPGPVRLRVRRGAERLEVELELVVLF